MPESSKINEQKQIQDLKLNALLEVTKAINNNFSTSLLLDLFQEILEKNAHDFSAATTQDASFDSIKTQTPDIIILDTKVKNPRNYSNLFPSAHLTYTVSADNSFQISYSRRVRRPTYNDLSPFVTLSDQRNFFSGNPNLNPEFTNSFDLGHLYDFDKGSISSSLYYRQTIENS